MIEGDWQTAQTVLQISDPSSLMELSGRAAYRGLSGAIARWQGDRAIASELVAEELPDGPAAEPGDCRFHRAFPCIRLAADLALESGDLTQACAWIEAHDRWLAWSGAVLGQSEGQALWAAYHRAAGDPMAAYSHAERALAHATEPRQPLALLAANRLLGELDTEAGRYDAAGAHLAASLALADACHAPFEQALTLLALAELRAATGDVGEARTLLDNVRAICTPLGAQPTLARADTLVARLAP